MIRLTNRTVKFIYFKQAIRPIKPIIRSGIIGILHKPFLFSSTEITDKTFARLISKHVNII